MWSNINLISSGIMTMGSHELSFYIFTLHEETTVQMVRHIDG